MKLLELKPQDFPVTLLLQLNGLSKKYILVKMKQDKLLLNKPVERLPEEK